MPNVWNSNNTSVSVEAGMLGVGQVVKCMQLETIHLISLVPRPSHPSVCRLQY